MGNGVRNLFLVVCYVVTEGDRLPSPRRRDVTRPIVHTADAIQKVKFSADTNGPAIAEVGSAVGIPVEIRKPVTIRKLARETPNTAPMPNIRLMIPEANPMWCLGVKCMIPTLLAGLKNPFFLYVGIIPVNTCGVGLLFLDFPVRLL